MSDEDLSKQIREAENERLLGGRLERVSRVTREKHKCKLPEKWQLDLVEGDVWHCDCDKRYKWVKKYAFEPDGTRRSIATIYVWKRIYPRGVMTAIWLFRALVATALLFVFFNFAGGITFIVFIVTFILVLGIETLVDKYAK